LTALLPPQVLLLGAEAAPGGQWTVFNNQIIAQFVSLPAQQQAWLRLHVRVDSSEPLLAKATAFGAEPDQEPFDNVATSIIRSAPASNLSVSRAADRLHIEWPESRTLIVEQSDSVGPNALWQPAQPAPVLVQGRWRLTVLPIAHARFYRFNGL
jgi:hypothetical protein